MKAGAVHIAAELGISLFTVKRHMQNITANLGVDGRAAVGAWVGRVEALTADAAEDGHSRFGREANSRS